jgi:hypothetical protein
MCQKGPTNLKQKVGDWGQVGSGGHRGSPIKGSDQDKKSTHWLSQPNLFFFG